LNGPIVTGQIEFGLFEGQGLEEGAEPNKDQGVYVIIWRCIHGQLEEVAMVDEPGFRDGSLHQLDKRGQP
jgi:hypothetical protein